MTLVLFDIDGTLLRRAGSHHRAALVEGIRRVTGLETTLDGVDTSGMLDRDLIAAMLRTAGASRSRVRSEMRRIVTECQSAYAADCASDLRDRVCPAVRDVLAKIPVSGVVTGNLSAIGWKKLELAGLRHFFSVGAFAEDGTTRTRVARVALWRARRAGLVRGKAKVTLVGDHFNDIAAAKANGFQSVAVATGLTPIEALRQAEPDILVSDLSELPVERLL